MSNLDHAEDDADQTFWYNPVGSAVQSCASDPPPTHVSAEKKHWIEIALVDEKGHPVAGEAYKLKLPGGQIVTGNLDSRGLARMQGIDAGTCKVSFPDLDHGAWRPL